jgi:Domain of unknown function (DUF4190)
MYGPGAGGGSNGLAIASLVCGIIGIFIFNIILGPLAIIFGGIGLSRANRGAGRRGLSIAGITLGIIDVVLFFIVLAIAAHHGFSWHAG